MESGYRIVPATAAHVASIAAIERAANQLFPERDLPGPMRNDVTPPAQLAAAQAEGRLWVVLAAAGEPVGFAFVRLLAAQPHLQEMDVHPEHGRRGLGRALLDEVCRWARARGYRQLSLTTFRHLPWNAPFYTRQGFRSLGESELDDALRDVLCAEAEEGFDPVRRVAMRRQLDGD